jgi:chromosome segregation ATPase
MSDDFEIVRKPLRVRQHDTGAMVDVVPGLEALDRIEARLREAEERNKKYVEHIRSESSRLAQIDASRNVAADRLREAEEGSRRLADDNETLYARVAELEQSLRHSQEACDERRRLHQQAETHVAELERAADEYAADRDRELAKRLSAEDRIAELERENKRLREQIVDIRLGEAQLVQALEILAFRHSGPDWREDPSMAQQRRALGVHAE